MTHPLDDLMADAAVKARCNLRQLRHAGPLLFLALPAGRYADIWLVGCPPSTKLILAISRHMCRVQGAIGAVLILPVEGKLRPDEPDAPTERGVCLSGVWSDGERRDRTYAVASYEDGSRLDPRPDPQDTPPDMATLLPMTPDRARVYNGGMRW